MTAHAIGWRCERCEVTVRWMPGCESRGLPTGWAEQNDIAFCLSCRRALAGEAGIEAAGTSQSAAAQARARRDATVEFEIGRDGDRSDQVIARACNTSSIVVARTRKQRC